MIIPVELIQIISEFTDFKTQLKLTELCKECNNYLKIFEIMDRKITLKLTQEILYQKKYDQLVKLSVNHNGKIHNVNHLKNTLSELHCGFGCEINQSGIQEDKRHDRRLSYQSSDRSNP